MTDDNWGEGRKGNYRSALEQEVLAKLRRQAPPGAEMGPPYRPEQSGHPSDFFWRLVQEYFEKGPPFPKRLKDVTKAAFGIPTEEDTIPWGQIGDLSIPAGTVLAAAQSLNKQRPQMVHVSRDRPTTFTLLTVVDYGFGWTGIPGENVGVAIDYILGVGQVKVLVKHALPVLSDAALFNGAQQVDIFTVPMMAVQATARVYDLTLSGIETVQRSIVVTTLAAPVVQ